MASIQFKCYIMQQGDKYESIILDPDNNRIELTAKS